MWDEAKVAVLRGAFSDLLAVPIPSYDFRITNFRYFFRCMCSQMSGSMSDEVKVAVLRGAFPDLGTEELAAVLQASGGSLVEAHLLMQINLNKVCNPTSGPPAPAALT